MLSVAPDSCCPSVFEMVNKLSVQPDVTFHNEIENYTDVDNKQVILLRILSFECLACFLMVEPNSNGIFLYNMTVTLHVFLYFQEMVFPLKEPWRNHYFFMLGKALL